MRTILILLLLAAPCLAAEYPKSGITVINGIVVPTLPDEAKAMSPAEFHAWAIQQNDRVRNEANTRNAATRVGIGDRSVHGSISQESTISKQRFGGGVGVGGFGGQGGYAGYSNQYVGNTFGFNYGFGFNQPGNASQTSQSGASKTYEKVWYDNSYYGGSITVINPFCPPSK